MHRITPIAFMVAALLVALSLPALAQERTFVSPMSGDEEVPAVETDASGDAQYMLSEDGTQMSFRVEVTDLEDVTMAHIHLAPAGENGPPVVWLHSPAGEPELVEGVTTGTLATGSFSADDLVGPLEGATLDDLVEEMAAGNTYTNVHTEAFPDGEVRGQIAEVEAEEVEQPERVDTGAGGTAGAAGGSSLALAIGLLAVAGVSVLLVRRRVTA